MTTYVGIDLSLTSTGIAVITEGKISLHRIVSKGTRADTLASRRARINRIVNEVLADIPATVTAIAVEGPSYGQRQQSGVHDRSGLWWLTIDGIARVWGLEPIEIAPTVRAKYLAGRGNAPKDQCLAAAVRRYPDADVSGNDVADALALAAILARLHGEPIEDSLPTANLAALDKLQRPGATR